MSGLNCLKLSSILSNICNTTQLDNATKCHHGFKNFLGEPCLQKRCECFTGHIFDSILMKLGQNLCLDEVSQEFENGSCGVKN